MPKLPALLRNRFIAATVSLAALILFLAIDVHLAASHHIAQEKARLQSQGHPLSKADLPGPIHEMSRGAACEYEAAAAICGDRLIVGFAPTIATVVDRRPGDCALDVAAHLQVFALLAIGYEERECQFATVDTDGFQSVRVRQLAQVMAMQAMADVRAGRYGDALILTAHMLRFESRWQRRGGLSEIVTMSACVQYTLEPVVDMLRHGVRADYSCVLRELADVRTAQVSRLRQSVDDVRLSAIREYEHPQDGDRAWQAHVVDQAGFWISTAYTIAPTAMMELDESCCLDAMRGIERVIASTELEADTASMTEAQLKTRRDRLTADMTSPVPAYAPIAKCTVPCASCVLDEFERSVEAVDFVAARGKSLMQ